MLRKIFRFGISGCFATIVHFFVAWLVFNHIESQASVANAVAFVVANIASYVLHTLWSFSSEMNAAQFLRFILVSMIGFGLSCGIPFAIGPDKFWLSTTVVLIAVPITSFLLHNFWTYHS